MLRTGEVPAEGSGLMKHGLEPLWVSGKVLEGRVSMNLLPLNAQNIAQKLDNAVLDANSVQWFALLCCHLQCHGIEEVVTDRSGAAVQASVHCLAKEGRELRAHSGGEQISGKCPVLQHHGIGQVTIGNGISGVLLPLAALVPKGSHDHTLGSVEGCQVNGGKVSRHGLEPLWVSEVGLRGRVSVNLLPSTH